MKSKTMSFKVDEDLENRLMKYLASKNGKTFDGRSQFIKFALNEAMKNQLTNPLKT